jgi:hypothetical protein
VFPFLSDARIALRRESVNFVGLAITPLFTPRLR